MAFGSLGASQVNFPSNASYLLIGGLGGLDRSILRWMVANGARNLIYVSQSGASSTEAKELIWELEIIGTRYSILKCSTTDATTLLHDGWGTEPGQDWPAGHP